ncbi:MAG: redoxin domain-containing protein [Anaerolineae bacterium]|nr:redoxin domain-containing protein [Anaerolineae bacterium]
MRRVKSLPAVGERMPGFRLPSSDARRVDRDDYRGRHNLVVVFSGGHEEGAASALLRKLASREEDLELERALVLLVIPRSEAGALAFARRARLPFSVLADESGEAHLAVGAAGPEGELRPAVFVLDRWGTVYARFLPEGEEGWPEAGDILGWLEYIQIQCPE